MWYSSKSRNEKAERLSKVENTVSYPVNFEEHINGMHAGNINRNKQKRLLNSRAITYCLLFVLLVVTAGVTARQLLVKSESEKNEAAYKNQMCECAAQRKKGTSNKTATYKKQFIKTCQQKVEKFKFVCKGYND